MASKCVFQEFLNIELEASNLNLMLGNESLYSLLFLLNIILSFQKYDTQMVIHCLVFYLTH